MSDGICKMTSIFADKWCRISSMTLKEFIIFGVPQGSVLGPLFFTLYTTPLSSMICEHAIPQHLFADDSQLYVFFASGDSAAALDCLHSCLACVQSWMSPNKLKLNPDKILNSSLLGMNYSGANTSLCFRLSFSMSKLTLLNLLGILEWYLIKISPFAHMQSVAHAFTICGICGVFAATLIWIVQNYLQLLSCLVVSIIAIHFCMVLLTSTSQGFNMYRINWPAWWQSLLHVLAAFHCFVLFIGCQ